MPASTAYATTYLNPAALSDQVGSPAGTAGPLGKWRFKVAGALNVLQMKLIEGNSAANAQAYVAATSHYKFVSQAAGDLGNQAVLTDFTAITTV